MWFSPKNNELLKVDEYLKQVISNIDPNIEEDYPEYPIHTLHRLFFWLPQF